MARRQPTMRLNNVDLPTFGRPTIAMIGTPVVSGFSCNEVKVKSVAVSRQRSLLTSLWCSKNKCRFLRAARKKRHLFFEHQRLVSRLRCRETATDFTLTSLQENPLTTGVPIIAIVGRPNVGKSTLFNRIVGWRRAIVGDEPGITRDRLYGDAEWNGRRLRVVDTGGILPEEKDLIPAEIFRQARVALDEAAAIIMVVDGRSELASPDLELVRLLRKVNRPLFLAVNKVDSEKQSTLISDFHRLGIEQIFPIS